MELDEAELVRRSQDGDLGAFNSIVERYQGLVLNVAARVVGDRASAEDVTQETFISAYRSIRGFRGGSLRAWLSRIAINIGLDLLRKRRRRPESSLDEAQEEVGFEVASPAAGPERQAVLGELREEIERGILSLPANQRATLVLVDVQGFSYEEAARALATSVGTVKSRLSRARARVRDHLIKRRELLPSAFRR